jgi:mannose-6-phosphate isomerase-like protein (cupin superfamily)
VSRLLRRQRGVVQTRCRRINDTRVARCRRPRGNAPPKAQVTVRRLPVPGDVHFAASLGPCARAVGDDHGYDDVCLAPDRAGLHANQPKGRAMPAIRTVRVAICAPALAVCSISQGCATARTTEVRSGAPARATVSSVTPPAPSDSVRSGHVIAPELGERLVYCELPLVLTVKVDSGTAPGTRLRAASGVLSRGSEFGVHRDADEVLYVTRGRGHAVVGADTVPIEPGSVMFVPQNTPHGLVNSSDQTLEYFVVHAPQTSAAGFRRRAAQPGPYCPRRAP